MSANPQPVTITKYPIIKYVYEGEHLWQVWDELKTIKKNKQGVDVVRGSSGKYWPVRTAQDGSLYYLARDDTWAWAKTVRVPVYVVNHPMYKWSDASSGKVVPVQREDEKKFWEECDKGVWVDVS